MTAPPEPVLLEERDGRIVFLTLNRPNKRNALSNALFTAMIAAFERLELDESVGVIVLTGAGPAFCAGGDVEEMPGDSKARTFDERVTDLRRRADVVRQIAESSKLTIAAVNGTAAGAGLSLALACDFRIASTSARFVTAFIKVALSGDCGCVHQLANLIGVAKAKELCFLSEPVSAEEAERIGLVMRSVAPEELLEETKALACRLAAGPTIAQRNMKEGFRKIGYPLAEAIRDEATLLIQTAHSSDHNEAKRAFAEKRSPVFTGN